MFFIFRFATGATAMKMTAKTLMHQVALLLEVRVQLVLELVVLCVVRSIAALGGGATTA